MRCSCFSVALVCFERRGSLPLASHGDAAWARIAAILGWRGGEMKYRQVARRARRLGMSVEHIVAMIRGYAAAAVATRIHSRGDPLAEKLEALGKLLEMIGADEVHLILDHGLIPCAESEARRLVRRASTLRFASSRRTRGVQLADIAAGACREEGVCDNDEC